MKKLLLLTAIFAFGVTATQAQDKPNKEKTVNSKEVSKTRGANPNIKSAKPTTDTPEADPSKSRGSGSGTCQVYFNNHTGYVVDVYVDGNFKGTLAAYGSGNVYVGSGYTTVYCISAGGTREWSDKGDCSYYAAENLY